MRTAAFALLGALLGMLVLAAAGLGAGLAYVELAGVSGFEGYSGYVAGFWMLAGGALGLVGGAVLGARRARRTRR